jgi:predicted nucleotidyltransferase
MESGFSLKAREGDLIQTKNDVIFDVKGLVHPPNRIIAFPRFIPSPTGTRRKRMELYGKIYNLAERFRYLQENMPSLVVHDPVFDENLCEVPREFVKKHYQPTQKIKRLRFSKRLTDLERKTLQLAVSLKETADIPWNSVGISGSLLVNLYTSGSDIDPVVYGIENCRKAYAALEQLLKTGNSRFKPYSREELHTLFDFRSKDTLMRFEDFTRVESRKAFQGKYEGTDFFVRFVKNHHEINEQYGDLCYKNCGYAKIAATIDDDSEALFTPCTYKIKNSILVEGPKLKAISEIVSFRGRFCVQAKKGEGVVAQGKIEQVIDKRQGKEYHRIILGNNPSDYMVLSNL